MKVNIPDEGTDILKIDCSPTKYEDEMEYIIVGDFPSKLEVANNKPFDNSEGKNLKRVFSVLNIPYYKLYLTHACKTYIKNSDAIYTKKFTHLDYYKLRNNLIDELASLNIKLIIVVGELALKLLLDDDKVNSISKHRGSIYEADYFTGLEKLKGKYIGITYPPKMMNPSQVPKTFYIIMADIKKFIIYSEHKYNETGIHIITNPVFMEVNNFFHEAIYFNPNQEISFDIEATFQYVTCFSLAFKDVDNTIVSMSIPLMYNDGNYWTLEDEIFIWTYLQKILIDEKIKIICQNGMFDIMFILRTMNIVTNNFYFDTMIAQNIVYSDFPKGLDFLTSIYTNFPYYKEDGKQEHLKHIKDWDSYWIYNAKDSAYLFPIKDRLEEELEIFNAKDSMKYSMDLHIPLMEMEYNGILVDVEGIKKAKHIYKRKVKALERGLNKLIGTEINLKSSKQISDYFYGQKRIKPYINRKTHTITCDYMALSRIARKNVSGSVEAKMLMKYRKYNKLLSTYFIDNVDADNRLRCSYNITGTKTGRLSSNKTFFGTGTNLQNQPYLFKKYLIADEDYYLFEVDLAKAEAHIVAFVCEDGAMINAFESKIDIHSFFASEIFKVSMDEIKAEKKIPGKVTRRDLGKKTVHASNYGMSGQTFSDNLAKEEVFISRSECDKLLNAYSVRFPALKRWHKTIRDEVSTTKVLHNLFNRPKRFLDYPNDNLFRSAYAYIPQSTVAELLNRGLIKISQDTFFKEPNHKIKLLATVHDSILFEIEKSLVDFYPEILNKIKDHLTHEFNHKGRKFTIGLDAKIGNRWAEDIQEIKSFDKEGVDNAISLLNSN